MAEPGIALNVTYTDAYEPWTKRVDVSGDRNEPLAMALERALSSQVGGLSKVNRNYTFLFTDPDFPEDDIFIVDSRVTLGMVYDYFGDFAIEIDNGGRGGGGQPTQTLSSIVTEGLTSGGVRKVTFALWRLAAEQKWREHRQAAKDWDDTDKISTRLEQLVLAENPWLRKDFDRAFKLERSRASKLLTQLGYERRADADGTEYWHDHSSEERYRPSDG